ncbi:MAG: T9SS type A sorting domain-containing protein [Bacteroidetes bacterium]|nr:T9SS type A sorting domain-containing protein [Bacteroidota bacterium]
MSIFNSIGLKVYENKKVSSGESIDVSGLTSGVYYIEVNDFRKEKIVICR